MIAERTSAYDLTTNTVTGLTARVEHHPSVVPAIVHRIAAACVRYLKTPVLLPYAELWAASLTVDLISDREPRSRPDKYVMESDCQPDAWLRR
jgi:hypothetical protein